MGLRDELKAFLEAELGDVAIHAAGAEITSSPAIAINPQDPYVVPATFGSGPDNSTLLVGLELWLIVGRAGPQDVRLTELEQLRKRVTDAVCWGDFTPPGRWEQLADFGVIEIGGQQHATARLDMVFRDTDR